MLLIILTLVFVLFVIGYFFLMRYLQSRRGAGLSKAGETAKKLDDLFIQNAKRWARVLCVYLPLVMFMIGFLLPSSFTGLDKLLLDNVVRLNKQGLHEQAITMLSGVQRGSSPLMHNELGVAQLGLGRREQALRNFEQATKLLPEYSQAHANRAEVYTQMGRYTDAEFEYKRAEDFASIVLNPELIYGRSDATIKTLIIRLVFAGAFLLLGINLAKIVVNYLYRCRLKKFEYDLPDTLGILSNSLKAGLSLTQSIELLVKQTTAPINQEFGLVLKEYKIGKSIDDALKGIYRRLPTEDNQVLTNTISLLFETGGDIPEAIENLALTIRERRRIKLKIESLTAEGKAQAVMLILIPLAIAGILYSTEKETFSLLYTTMMGWIMIFVMLILASMGVWSMWKILQIKV